MPDPDFQDFDEALDERGFLRLEEAEPNLVRAIRFAIASGATPGQIRARAFRSERSIWFAAKVEQAARYINRQREEATLRGEE